jgi:aminopeptidase N
MDGTCGDVSPLLIEAVKKTLTAQGVDSSLKAYALTPPSLSTLAEELDVVDPDALTTANKHVKKAIATALKAELLEVYTANKLPAEPFRKDAEAVGMRRLKNVCLDYLSTLGDADITALALEQLKMGASMTDMVAATAVQNASRPPPKKNPKVDIES